MSYLYKTKGTCSTMIEVELDGHIVKDVKFTGGCNGNLKAIPKLVQGLTVEQVEEKLSASPVPDVLLPRRSAGKSLSCCPGSTEA